MGIRIRDLALPFPALPQLNCGSWVPVNALVFPQDRTPQKETFVCPDSVRQGKQGGVSGNLSEREPSRMCMHISPAQGLYT
jgi:hypothetical protein